MERTSLQWQDASGQERLTYLHSTSGAPFTQLSLEAMSCGGLNGWWSGSLFTVVGPSPAYSDYYSVGDMTALSITDAFGNQSRIYIPAVDLSFFDSDGYTLAITDVTILLMLATLVANFTNIPSSASYMTGASGGFLVRRGQRIRDTYQASAAQPMLRRGIVWADIQGRTTLTLLTAGQTMTASMASLATISNAAISAYWEGGLNVVTPASSPGPFANILDEVRFNCFDAYGNASRVVLPAPLASILMPDQKTVDMTNSLVTAFVANAISELLVASSGEPVVSVPNGFLYQSKQTGIR